MCHHSLETNDKCKCFHKCHSSSSNCSVSQRYLSIPSILGLNLSSYKVPPAKSVLTTICCRLSLIGMLLEYYCEAGRELFKCRCIVIPSDPVVTIRHGQLGPKLGPVQGSTRPKIIIISWMPENNSDHCRFFTLEIFSL